MILSDPAVAERGAAPWVSVVINTLDRAGPLRTLLRALEHQSYPHFEVIVVVGPTRDDTLAMLAEYEGRIGLIHCPSANLSHSRNLGLLAARGDLVAFVDDDAVPCQRWLEQYVRILADDKIDATGGSVWAAHPRFTALQYRLGIYSALAEQEDVRASWVEQIVPRGRATRWMARLPGGNLCIRRRAALEIGGFDEFYEFVAEETDLALRLADQGKLVRPVKEAPIYHFPATGRNRVAFTNKGRWWLRSRSRVYLGLKHGVASGEGLSPILARTLRSAGAHFPWYLSLLRDRQLNPGEFLNLCAHEVGGSLNALIHGLFVPPQLIPLPERQAALQNQAPALPFQNEHSAMQPSVDPLSGRQPVIAMPEPPLRLCLLSSSYPPTQYGGIARLTHLMAQGLFELGHTVHVVTRAEREETTFYDGAYVHKIPNRLERYDHLKNYYNLYATLNYSHNVYDKVRRLMLNDGIQIVDSPFWQYEGLVTLMSGLLPVVVRLVTGIRQVSEIHHNEVEEFRLMGDLEQALLDQADYLLPNTQATYAAMQKVYDFRAARGRCAVVPYGLVPAPEEDVRPFDLQASKARLTVLYVGRLEKRKGVLDLFEAIPQVLARLPGTKFILAGSDNSQSDNFRLQTGMDYPAYFASRHPECLPNVQFMGMVSDEVLQTLYQNCDLFVAPSLYESFGLIYLEAMNYAKPVIGCRAGGIPEVIDHGQSGLLVEPGAAKELAEAILKLLQSPQQLHDLGLAGRRQILERFNYLTMARNFARIYREVIAASQAAGASPSAEKLIV